ncbi:guanine nucleotide-binding G(s) subunit alpha [Brachionus plicatilis]|uniref:Guanine nucleotide-binding protein G(s) subunit alpha n=1 Tax=Brachionus plicatilis TaxID=10195 RepID=A0A3M7RRV1_BRAPC|nr:guanine nucleotide-binding G(s) subunit alpha [Brachionus plicatilis]
MFKSCIDKCLKPEKSKQANEDQMNKRRSKQIDRELKKSSHLQSIKLLLLGTGESGKSTILKQMRIIYISGFSTEERIEKIYDIKSNIRDAILSILDSMQRFTFQLETEQLIECAEFLFENSHLLASKTNNQDEKIIEKLWDCIEVLWADKNVKECAKHGNEYHLIDSAEYFLDRIAAIRTKNYLPTNQDILRCRVLTTGICETQFQLKNVNFQILDVGGQRDQRKKWIQCFNGVTAIMFVVDISSFNMTLREDKNVNRLRESLNSFRQIWINRYLFNTPVLLFLNKYDLFVKKILHENFKLGDYFPEYNDFEMPKKINRELLIENEHPEVTRARLFIHEQFSNITNETLFDSIHTFAVNEAQSVRNNEETILNNELSENLECKILDQFKKSYYGFELDKISGKFCIPYTTCAIDTDNINRVFNGCKEILKKEHLEKSGLI